MAEFLVTPENHKWGQLLRVALTMLLHTGVSAEPNSALHAAYRQAHYRPSVICLMQILCCTAYPHPFGVHQIDIRAAMARGRLPGCGGARQLHLSSFVKPLYPL